jgi:transposase
VVKWLQRFQTTGSAAAKPMGGVRRAVLAEHRSWLLQRIKDQPDLTLHALRSELAERGVTVSVWAVWKFCFSERLSFKKTLLPSEQDRPAVARKRERWKQLQKLLDPTRLGFLDETWVKTNMVRRRGGAPRGQRLTQKVPHGHWKTMTFIGVLRSDRIDAPCILDQPVNRRSFLEYVKQVLVPTLRKGDVVLMDNLNSHKNRAVRQAIRAVGAKLWLLPAYSPDLNPIEQMFAKLKQGLRKAARRGIDEVCAEIGKLLETFTPRNAPTTWPMLDTPGLRPARRPSRTVQLGPKML